jgi:CheY-like chemotaxis protein
VKKQILVVDDNPDSREMLSFILTGKGFSVITAEDGLEALEVVKEVQPDLILTDIHMPNIDGIELTKQLREQFKSTSLPIVILTAFGSEMISKAIEAGADGAVQKPLHLDSLLTLVKQILS